MGRYTGILGILTMLGVAFAFSTNRRAIRVKTVAWGLGLQFVFAIFVLRIEAGRRMFQIAGDAANRVLNYAFAGSQFVFGDLGKQFSHIGFIFAFQVLPTVIFICAFFAILYHYGIMQFVIRIAAWAMTRIMGASGAESLNVAASIFMGQTEAPVTIRPFLPELTHSELMTVMTSGMAHVSGSIMAAYFAFGVEPQTRAERGYHDRPRYNSALQDARARDRAAENRRAGHHERSRRGAREKRKICWAQWPAAPVTACTWPSTSAPC